MWTSSVVLAGFMGGLAIGNGLAGPLGSRVGKPIHLYAVLELIIGVVGAGIVFLLPHVTPMLTPVFRMVIDQPAALNAARLGVAFPLLLMPSIAMGATLPLLVAAVVRRDTPFGHALGQLYGWNTLGAVAGSLVDFGVFNALMFATMAAAPKILTTAAAARPRMGRRPMRAPAVTG